MIHCSPSFTERSSSQKCHPFVGVDDFVFRKGHTYGTLICDHQKGVPLALLSDRNPETVALWLKQFPHIQMVTRDGFTAFR